MKLYRLSFIFSALALVLNACQPESYKEVGVLTAPLTGLSGTWKLTKVTQTDEDALRKGFPFQTLDLTSVFPYTDFKLTLSANGTTPTTFTTTPGNSPKIIKLTSGNWTVDDPNYPKVITMANATDTARITLGSYPSATNPLLKVRLERRDAATNKLLISYSYEFTKQ
jgi:hypothetical protein